MALPFTLASFIALALPLLAGQQTVNMVQPVMGKRLSIVDADDYAAHIEFQSNFSFRRLAADDGQSGYTNFVIGADDLFHPAADIAPSPPSIAGGTPPPFPLEKLIRFLTGNGENVPLPVVFDIRVLIAVIIGTALYLPALTVTPDITNRKKERNRLYINQRVSA